MKNIDPTIVVGAVVRLTEEKKQSSRIHSKFMPWFEGEDILKATAKLVVADVEALDDQRRMGLRDRIKEIRIRRSLRPVMAQVLSGLVEQGTLSKGRSGDFDGANAWVHTRDVSPGYLYQLAELPSMPPADSAIDA